MSTICQADLTVEEKLCINEMLKGIKKHPSSKRNTCAHGIVEDSMVESPDFEEPQIPVSYSIRFDIDEEDCPMEQWNAEFVLEWWLCPVPAAFLLLLPRAAPMVAWVQFRSANAWKLVCLGVEGTFRPYHDSMRACPCPYSLRTKNFAVAAQSDKTNCYQML